MKVAVAAEAAAAKSLKIVTAQYKLGQVAQAIVLVAEQTYLNAVVNRVQAQALRYSDTAALFQALGGGWWNRNEDLARVDSVAQAKISRSRSLSKAQAGHRRGLRHHSGEVAAVASPSSLGGYSEAGYVDAD